MRRGARPIRHAVSLALAALAVAPACSQASRESAYARIRHSVPATPGRRIAGTYALHFLAAEVGGAREGQLARRAGPVARSAFVADPAARRVAMRGAPDAPAFFLTAGRSFYARRITSRADEPRPWVRVDFEHANDPGTPKLRALLDASSAGDIAVLSPQLLLDLLTGALTGSIENLGPVPGGTKYRFNASVDKANRTLRLSDDARKDRRKQLRSLAITADIHRAVAVLRDNGTLAHLEVTFVEQPDKQARLTFVGSLDLAEPGSTSGFGTRRSLAPPTRSATIRVRTLGEIRGALNAQLERLRHDSGSADASGSAGPTATTTTTTTAMAQ